MHYYLGYQHLGHPDTEANKHGHLASSPGILYVFNMCSAKLCIKHIKPRQKSEDRNFLGWKAKKRTAFSYMSAHGLTWGSRVLVSEAKAPSPR